MGALEDKTRHFITTYSAGTEDDQSLPPVSCSLTNKQTSSSHLNTLPKVEAGLFIPFKKFSSLMVKKLYIKIKKTVNAVLFWINLAMSLFTHLRFFRQACFRYVNTLYPLPTKSI